MRSFPLKVLTPLGEAFVGEIQELVIRTTGGEVGILAGHIDFLAGIEACAAKIIDGEGKERYAFCGGGFFSMTAGEASLVTDEFLFATQLDEDSIETAYTDCCARLASCSDEQTKRFLTAELRRSELKKKALNAQKEVR